MYMGNMTLKGSVTKYFVYRTLKGSVTKYFVYSYLIMSSSIVDTFSRFIQPSLLQFCDYCFVHC